MIPLKDSEPSGIFPFWVLTIIGLNIYMFFLELTAPDLDIFITQYALIPSQVDFSSLTSLYPFVTSQFLHGGFLHIISNMLFLWIFGDNVEGRFGFLLFPLIYLASGVAGALTQYFFMPQSSIPMLGASGAIAGILGAYFAWFGHHTVKTLVPVFGFITVMNIPASVMLLYWFITQIFSGVASIAYTTADVGGVAFFAHAGGFGFGWIAAKLFAPKTSNVVEL
jgi:membrane associated rhomboid family serine protease